MRKTRIKTVYFIVLGIFLLSCAPITRLSTPEPAGNAPTLPTEESLTVQSTPDIATATQVPVLAPTATVYPPIFSYDALGDIRELDSYTLTRTKKETGGRVAEEHRDTIGYIKEPFNAFIVEEYYSGGQDIFGDQPHQEYFVNGRSYKMTGSEDWIISPESDTDDLDYFLQSKADIREGYPKYNVEGAQFTGPEEFEGMPAYHFTFDETNLAHTENPDQGYKIETAQGDLYLSQTGNYLLYFHIKLAGTIVFDPYVNGYVPGTVEVTEELSSINQVTDIAVPPEYLEAEQTLLDLNLPLPAGSTLFLMRRFAGISVDSYFYSTSLGKEQFLEFYRNMPPTNGWAVSHIGPVANHAYCQDHDCVIIKKGDAQVILNGGDGGFEADYDWGHLYSPQ